MTEREALKLALDAFGEIAWSNETQWQRDRAKEAIVAIKEALAQPEQEPVAWGVDWGKAGDIPCVSIIKRLPDGGIKVMAVEYAPYSYTAPPQRTWVGLTADEMEGLYQLATYMDDTDYIHMLMMAEAKLKEKNR